MYDVKRRRVEDVVCEGHRGKKNSNKTKDGVLAAVQTHIGRFPNIESHLTRSDTDESI